MKIKRLECHTCASTYRGIINNDDKHRCPFRWAIQPKCIQPTDYTHRFASETHARSEKQRTFGVESFLRCLLLSCSHDTDNDHENGQDDEDDKDDKDDHRQQDEGSLEESHRDTSRAKILPGIHLGPSSSGVSEGSARPYGLSRWVTQGSTAPGGVL